MKKWLLAVVTVLVLAACGDTEQEKHNVTEEDTQEIIDKGTVGYEVMGDSIEEAENVPAEEKDKILAAFNEYIDAFNDEDIKRYAQTTSKHAKGFDYDVDLEEAKEAFGKYAINRQADDVTIVKYDDKEAQVFANLAIDMTEEETDTQVSSAGRQVTVFVKEDSDWKVSSIYYIEKQ
jgi:ketosteroid isomerase-like protein